MGGIGVKSEVIDFDPESFISHVEHLSCIRFFVRAITLWNTKTIRSLIKWLPVSLEAIELVLLSTLDSRR
eukprot:6332566-Ditylum_brightwellii.AAC.1